MAPVLWRILGMLAVIQLAFAAQIIQNKSAPPSPKESTPLFAPEHESRPLRVLAIMPFGCHSHLLIFKTLMMEMARRGHQITMASPIALKTPVANFSHIDLTNLVYAYVGGLTFEMMTNSYKERSPLGHMSMMAEICGPDTCRNILGLPEIKAIINGEKQFDVLFTEIFSCDCFLAIGHKLQIPTISIVSTPAISWMYEYAGDIDNPAFVEHLLWEPTPTGLSSFVERAKNTYYNLMTKYRAETVVSRPSEEVVHEIFGEDFPSLRELRNNVSLILVNSHPTIFGAKPTVPRMLSVGGLHLTPPKPENVPNDVREWLETAPNGVVFFSCGSMLQPITIPENLLKAFVGAFKKHKHLRFLWKFGATEAEAKAVGIPDNVKIANWLPQNEILSHRNVVAFITHGGLMGTTEAIYHGVPMVAMPLFADQMINVYRYEKLGVVVRIDYNNLTEDDVASAVTKVMLDPSIRRRVKEVSRLFRDRPMSPMDSAIWWTEYVVRHGGAPHLESPTARMPFWQYALLDVAAAALAVLLTLVCVIYLVVRSIFRIFTRTKPTQTERRKKTD